MYSRKLDEKIYTFEPSGGLLHASLVMRDRETDSYWSILNDTAIWGKAQGTQMEQLPGAVKVTWGQWRSSHPNTLVLSSGGREHDARNPYDTYFASRRGFRNLTTPDERLKDKQLIYAFHWQGKPTVAPHSAFIGGGVFQLDDRELFLYRDGKDSLYRSSAAFLSQPGTRFVRHQGQWQVDPAGASWDAEARDFPGLTEDEVERFQGFDTYWYSWSLVNDSSEILRPR